MHVLPATACLPTPACLQVCRCAVDMLVESAQAAHDSGDAAEAPKPLVGMAGMSTALSRVAAAAGSTAGIHAKIKALPPHQQLALLGLAQVSGQMKTVTLNAEAARIARMK